jgi:hypothetical protein
LIGTRQKRLDCAGKVDGCGGDRRDAHLGR